MRMAGRSGTPWSEMTLSVIPGIIRLGAASRAGAVGRNGAGATGVLDRGTGGRSDSGDRRGDPDASLGSTIGFDTVRSKPFGRDQLAEAVERALAPGEDAGEEGVVVERPGVAATVGSGPG
jgi:hypothetical protein